MDSGAATSLIRKGLFHKTFRTEFTQPIIVNTINSKSTITSKITIPLFSEFNVKNVTIDMLECDLCSDFDGILGCNILGQLKAKLDFEQNTLMTPNAKFPLIYDNFETEPSIDEIVSYFEYDKIDVNFHRPELNVLTDRLELDHLNKEEISELINIIKEFNKAFYLEGDILSAVGQYKHRIPTLNDIPVYSRTYRFPEIHKAEVERQISEMLASGIIKKSSSPYNAPIWVVPKKIDNSGMQKWRVVVDYRKLNDITISDKFPIPNIEDLFSKLGKCLYFTTLDLAKGFHQIPISIEDGHKTAFSTHTGHYEFTRMPFGLKNAPASFQRMMNEVLHDYINNICVVYLDDILVFSTSLHEHIVSLRKIFRRLADYNLKVQIDKCNFFKRESEYLGHVITEHGIKPNPAKIEIIRKISLPRTVKDIRSFLGVTGFYRKFIKDYGRIALPLIKYLKKDFKIDMSDPEYINSFEKLKILLCQSPVLAYPNFEKVFLLTTDASNASLGAVLSQGGHPVAFASRTLDKHECNYSTIEKELLSIVWATKYFRPYLFGRKFKIQTDHKPLIWLNSLKEPNMKLHRWKMKLNEYDFDIEYIKGKANQVADFLSRVNINKLDEQVENSCENISNLAVASDIATVHSGLEQLNDHISITETAINLFKNQIVILIGKKYKCVQEKLYGRKIRYTITLSYYNEEIVLGMLRKILPIRGKIGIFCENFNIFKYFQATIVHYFSNTPDMTFFKCSRLLKDIFDREILMNIIEKYHSEKNHRGIQETYVELKDIIYYPNLQREIHRFINNCIICNMCKYDRHPIKPKFCLSDTPLQSNEVVHIDIWFLNKTLTFLTCIDKLTKHVSAHYLSDKNSITIAGKLRERFSIMGKPSKIVADNEFNTAYIKNFLSSENVEYHFTSPNVHTGNSDIERFHLTLNEHIRLFKLSLRDEQIDDSTLVFKAVQIYNDSIHSTTGEKPVNLLHNKFDSSVWKKLHEKVDRVRKNQIEKLNENRSECQDFRERELVKNLGFQAIKQKPKYIIKQVKENSKNNFTDEDGCKRDRQIVKRNYKYQNEIEDVKFDRKITGRSYFKSKSKT